MVKHCCKLTLALAVAAGPLHAETLYRYKAADGSVVFTDKPVEGASKMKVEAPMVMPSVLPKVRSKGSGNDVFWPEAGATTKPRVADTAVAPPSAPGNGSSFSWNADTQGVDRQPAAAPVMAAARVASEDTLKPAPVAQTQFSMTRQMSPRQRQRPEGSTYESVRVVTPSQDSSRWVGGDLSVFLATEPALRPGHEISIQLDGREVARGPELVASIPGVDRGTHALEAVVLDAETGERIDGSDQVIFTIHRPSVLRGGPRMDSSIRQNLAD